MFVVLTIISFGCLRNSCVRLLFRHHRKLADFIMRVFYLPFFLPPILQLKLCYIVDIWGQVIQMGVIMRNLFDCSSLVSCYYQSPPPSLDRRKFQFFVDVSTDKYIYIYIYSIWSQWSHVYCRVNNKLLESATLSQKKRCYLLVRNLAETQKQFFLSLFCSFFCSFFS